MSVDYDDLAARAERGEMRPLGEPLRGAEAARLGRESVFRATGTSSVEEATRVALGRPRLGERPTTALWKVRAPQALDEMVRAAARQRGSTASEFIRRAVASQIERDMARPGG